MCPLYDVDEFVVARIGEELVKDSPGHGNKMQIYCMVRKRGGLYDSIIYRNRCRVDVE